MINTDFPEHLFVPQKHKQGIYRYKVKLGLEICKKKSILFCGIARNVSNNLERNILCLSRTGQFFKDHHTFIYENNSTDDTLQILLNYNSDHLTFLHENRLDQDYQQFINNDTDPWGYNRCKVLARCRNKYLNYIDTADKTYDYICVLDCDLQGGWSYDGILHGIYTLESEQNNACVSSYGVLADFFNKQDLEDVVDNKYIMYDTLAFRPQNYNKIGSQGEGTKLNLLSFTRGDDPINVSSNFGGMAIYKSDVLKNKYYDATQKENNMVEPDHMFLNQQITKEGYNIILDPSMIVSYSYHQYS